MSVQKPAKHGRDHCIGGEDPIPCLGVQFFRAVYSDATGITGIGGTNKNLDWLWWQNGAPSIFEPRKTNGDPDPVNGTDLARYIRLKVPGRYTFSIGVRPEDAFNGFKISLNESPEDDPFGYAEDHYAGLNDGTYNTSGWLAWTFSRIYPMLDPFASDAANELVQWPDFAGGGFVGAYFTMAADLASGTTEVRHAFLDIGYEPVTFPTDTSWPQP
jgi:hypothetical protein